MSQPRRSARLRGEPAEYQGLDDHGVPVVDLTDVDDVQCSVCGLTDGIVHQFHVVARRLIVSVPFNVPVAMQSSLKGRALRTRRSAFCAAQSCRHKTDLWSLVASMHSIWNVLSALSSHVESGARFARLI